LLLLTAVQDQLKLELWSYFDGAELSVMACVCRATYVLSHIDDHWKALVLAWAAVPGRLLRTYGSSWRCTYLRLVQGLSCEAAQHTPIAIEGFYSDLLFQPHNCATTTLKDRWLQIESVQRRANLSVEQFMAKYEVPNVPVILTDVITKWPAMNKWSKQYFKSNYNKLPMHAGGVEMAMSDYFEYAEMTSDETPLYIFDKHFVNKAPGLAKDFSVPPYFQVHNTMQSPISTFA
jgi:Cupin-like domain